MSLQATGKNDIDFKYLLFLPQDYNESQKTRWPLILFLHGKGERGEDLDLVKIHGIPKIVATEKEFPFIAVSPQCPIDHVWADDFMQQKVLDLLSKIVHNYRVDRNRIYLTGLSMGGYGTWSLATSRPDLFAAAVPICGGGDPSTVSKLKDLPIRVFHGALDKVVLSENSRKIGHGATKSRRQCDLYIISGCQSRFVDRNVRQPWIIRLAAGPETDRSLEFLANS